MSPLISKCYGHKKKVWDEKKRKENPNQFNMQIETGFQFNLATHTPVYYWQAIFICVTSSAEGIDIKHFFFFF